MSAARKRKAAVEAVLVLRMCRADMTSYGGFVWPAEGPVSAPDWDPAPKCGGGLHGWLWGVGDAKAWDWAAGDKALVVEVPAGTTVEIDRKVKFPSGKAVFCGDLKDAAAFVRERSPDRTLPVIGFHASSGDYGTSTSGDYGTSTSGDYGTSTSGYYGPSTSGDYGTSTSGARGTSTSGDYGTSTSGDYGTSTSGYYGTSTSGDHGTSTSGNLGEIRIRWWDSKSSRCRTEIAYVGENGIEPNVAYVLDGTHKFVKKVLP